MVELPKNVGEFIVRDLIYIVGGGIVLTSFLHRFDRLPSRDTPLAFYLLGAGMAYVVGSTLQDVFSILRGVTTAHVTKLCQPWKWCYERFYAEPWKDIEAFDPTQARKALRSFKNSEESDASYYERCISGLILAATMTPCMLISALVVWSRWYGCRNQFDFWLAVALSLLSAGLWALVWVRAAQVTRTDADVTNEYRAKLKDPRSGRDTGNSTGATQGQAVP